MLPSCLRTQSPKKRPSKSFRDTRASLGWFVDNSHQAPSLTGKQAFSGKPGKLHSFEGVFGDIWRFLGNTRTTTIKWNFANWVESWPQGGMTPANYLPISSICNTEPSAPVTRTRAPAGKSRALETSQKPSSIRIFPCPPSTAFCKTNSRPM